MEGATCSSRVYLPEPPIGTPVAAVRVGHTVTLEGHGPIAQSVLRLWGERNRLREAAAAEHETEDDQDNNDHDDPVQHDAILSSVIPSLRYHVSSILSPRR